MNFFFNPCTLKFQTIRRAASMFYHQYVSRQKLSSLSDMQVTFSIVCLFLSSALICRTNRSLDGGGVVKGQGMQDRSVTRTACCHFENVSSTRTFRTTTPFLPRQSINRTYLLTRTLSVLLITIQRNNKNERNIQKSRVSTNKHNITIYIQQCSIV